MKKLKSGLNLYIIIVGVFFLAAAAVMQWREYLTVNQYGSHPQESIVRLENKFQLEHYPAFRLNPEQIRASRVSLELTDVEKTLPQTHLFSRKDLEPIYNMANSCKISPAPHDRRLLKTYFWHRAICQKNHLNDSFFAKAPFMHPSGVSFVILATRIGKAPYNNPQWLKNHLKFTHYLEQEPHLLNRTALNSIFNAESLILSDQYILFQHRDSSPAGTNVEFLAYPILDWNQYLKTQPFAITAKGSANCLFLEGSNCWQNNAPKNTRDVLLRAILFSFGLTALFLGLVFQFLRRQLSQKRALKHQSFILQMLTHELRTPITSLRLVLESFRAQYDELPNDSQKAFLRACDETKKLEKLIEASRRYVTPSNKTGRIQFEQQSISSINSYFVDFIERYEGQVQFTPLLQDGAAQIDPYWVELCVDNLVRNALIHGQTPVQLALENSQSKLKITVRDHGQLPQAQIGELYGRSTGTQGWGLGLLIVKTVAESLEGHLEMQTNPTTFSLTVKI